jgi:hypothetical protein
MKGEMMDRELGEVIAYAIAAYKKSVPVESIFAVTPTDANGYLAAFIVKAVEYHVAADASAKAAVLKIPAVVWWNEKEKHPVFNNANGADLILRSDVLKALAA